MKRVTTTRRGPAPGTVSTLPGGSGWVGAKRRIAQASPPCQLTEPTGSCVENLCGRQGQPALDRLQNTKQNANILVCPVSEQKPGGKSNDARVPEAEAGVGVAVRP